MKWGGYNRKGEERMNRIAKKVFGTANDRKVKATRPLVEKINALEPEFEALDDQGLKGLAVRFAVVGGDAIDHGGLHAVSLGDVCSDEGMRAIYLVVDGFAQVMKKGVQSMSGIGSELGAWSTGARTAAGVPQGEVLDLTLWIIHPNPGDTGEGADVAAGGGRGNVLALDRPGVGVHQQLRAVPPVAAPRVPGPMDPEAVPVAGPHPRYPPDMGGGCSTPQTAGLGNNLS